MNAYEVKGRYGVNCRQTVRSMPERLKVVCIPCKAIYKCSALSAVANYRTVRTISVRMNVWVNILQLRYMRVHCICEIWKITRMYTHQVCSAMHILCRAVTGELVLSSQHLQSKYTDKTLPTIDVFEEHGATTALQLSISHDGNTVPQHVSFVHEMCWQDYCASSSLTLKYVPHLSSCLRIHSRCRFVQNHELKTCATARHRWSKWMM